MNVNASEYLKRFEVSGPRVKIRSARDEQITRFYERGSIMITDRKTKELRRATEGEIAGLLGKAGYKTAEQMHALYRDCEWAQSFSKLFWYKVKRKGA